MESKFRRSKWKFEQVVIFDISEAEPKIKPPGRDLRPLRILHISDLHERATFEGISEERASQIRVDSEERGYVLGPTFLKALAEIDFGDPGAAFELIAPEGYVADGKWIPKGQFDARFT